MQDRTIDNALLALRKQIIRGDQNGLSNVEALILMRGVEMPRVLPPKRADVFRKGAMTRLVLQALKDRPKRLPAIAQHDSLAKPDIGYDAAYTRTSLALSKIKRRGLVCKDGRLWRLAQ